ncbi:hypothetical protein [Mariniflexile sp.]|uniref:hypothetical protein n=1 Tax=Mariniflexile sp. TaxID=1979402 RepID=UPI003567F9E3
MKLKYITILLVFFTASNLFSQKNLNNYKYVIVPVKYDFLKENDQFQLNSLTEFLFKKYGFTPLMEGGSYPADLLKNRCLALKSNLIKDSGMFKTKLAIELKNCNDQIVYTSEMGESREKEYQRAYTEALRSAFEYIEALNYKYVPSEVTNLAGLQEVEVSSEASKEIERLKQEIASIKNAKELESKSNVVSDKTVNATVEKSEPKKVIKKEAEIVAQLKKAETGILYAQAIENGFQLVDSSPKVVYKIKKTSIADVYLVENKDATLYKKDNIWVLEYYENNVLKQEELNIKF